MRRFLRKYVWFWVASSISLFGCSNGAKKEVVNDKSPESEKEMKVASGVRTSYLKEGVSVTWIQDNAQDKLMPLSLFADVPDSIIDNLSLRGGIPSSISTFLVEISGTRILFDTGIGVPNGRLLDGLKAMGLNPADIQYVYLTHFHGDHIGGMMIGDSVIFPNAGVYVSKVEYDAWMAMSDEKKAQVLRTMRGYKDRLHLFEFGDTLPGGVKAIEAVGHTPGHTVFQIGELLIVGDLMHGMALQMTYPEYCASYDMDKEKAVDTRKEILKYAKENGLTMAGMHFPDPAVIKLD